MERLLEMLGAKDEEEAIRRLKLLAAQPVSITIVATADGGMSLSTTGNPAPELVQTLLLDATRLVLMKKKEAGP
jgi:hypothetical protein